ncbi:hypothetical protein CAJAP_05181 [Camponotus japonicus]
MFFYGSWGQYAAKCINFKRCCCNSLDCGMVHTYRYCYQYQNTSCNAKDCPFLHCTIVEQYRYMMTDSLFEQTKTSLKNFYEAVL